MMRLRPLLEELATDHATGRVSVKGVRPAVVMVTDGRISLSERRDQPNLLIAMAEAGLFTAEEWAVALRIPTAHKWRALVGDDPVRLDRLTDFARAYTAQSLVSLLALDVCPVTFSERIQHPFGPLGTWTLEELVGAASVDEPVLAPDLHDRREFLEMLMEVSPLVRDPLV